MKLEVVAKGVLDAAELKRVLREVRHNEALLVPEGSNPDLTVTIIEEERTLRSPAVFGTALWVGYGGLMLSVFADGSTIYPSAVVEPTPRYDTGTFLAGGQDPMRKDVLEMLLRLFDREGLSLVPAVEFASPLPELEAVLRRGGPA